MPLHLLGKKSWNVYNPANIARVKQDEAEARSRQEAEEKHRQELDAERRLAILRGEVPPPPPTNDELDSTSPRSHHDANRKRLRDTENGDETTSSRQRDHRKRKRFGEDDTDFEMRVAREREEQASLRPNTNVAVVLSSKTSNAPIFDRQGHISLFPEEQDGRRGDGSQKNEEAEREAAKKRRDYEDQYTMRFSNAAGRDGVGVTGSGPWYTSKSSGGVSRDGTDDLGLGKDVWGNDDPKRRGRDAARVVSNDPLAMMKQGAAKAREVAREKRAINEERARELHQLCKEEKRRERKRRHRDHVDELEGFTLDGQDMGGGDDTEQERQKKHYHRDAQHRHSSDSRDRRDDRHDKDRHRYSSSRQDHPDHYEHRHENRHENRHSGSRGSRDDKQVESRRKSNKTDNY